MEFGFLKKMLALTVRQQLSVLTVEHEGISVTIDRRVKGADQASAPVIPQDKTTEIQPSSQQAVPLASQANLRAVKAPMAGVVHLSPKPDEAHFVVPGDVVQKGQQVAVIEAMKTFSAIKAPCSGIVENIVADTGEEVSGGQDILFIRPSMESSDT